MSLDEIEEREIFPGFKGKFVHSEKMSWVFWDVKKGSVVNEHQHINEQIMHVVKGKFEFVLNGKHNIYTDGDIVVISSNMSHSGKALTNCKLIDVFSPIREEYR
jgi:quercetin dioxygenase-like cupin family protein